MNDLLPPTSSPASRPSSRLRTMVAVAASAGKNLLVTLGYGARRLTTGLAGRRLLWGGGAIVVVALLVVVARYAATPTVAYVPPAPVVPQVYRETLKSTVPSGANATTLLGKYVNDQELHALVEKCRPIFPLTSLRAGNPYRIVQADRQFERFEYDISNEEQLIVTRENGQLLAKRYVIPFTSEERVITGTITSSLYEAVNAAGESDALAEALADIFAYDVDFIRDIRVGDSFRLLVEKRVREGRPPSYGAILAATFTNQGETFTAFRFQDGVNPVSYYDASGKALRKAFLKAPLPFSRVSSGFTMKRFHPIAKTWRAHPAIDYAAPVGTPIKTVGDGYISQAGFTSGNGNFVRVRHPNGYESLYLHMSKFAKGTRNGARVAQGQVIGYVGATGLATGPHLCFRMTKNGAPINPARIKAAATAPVSTANLPAFRNVTQPLLARLEGRAPVQVAAATPLQAAVPPTQAVR